MADGMATGGAHRAPRDIVLAFLNAAGDDDGAAFEVVAEDFLQHAAGPQGRAGLRLTAAILRNDVAPERAEIHHVVADGDTVVVHLTLHGVHRGSSMPLLANVPITARPIAWTFIHIFRVTDGAIAEHWACRDDLGLLVQLGAWPPAPAPTRPR